VRIGQAAGQFVVAPDHTVELCALLAERLRALRIVPDAGVFQFPVYLFQTFAFAVDVKDTPSGLPGALEGLEFADKSD
jgi:hypothetical protein